ncbi:polysaccharide deacetylase family protein [Mycobacterium sp. 236(2023)]|uniref:polysaccharide deacetylase family protein n=1 Tax=Mycobacterium sp. 236(2023) TaxID=3038163 RepID=UPI00241509B4|nr:polysaccharide deacetylase family protein [Mycobacterium sp. 236(2023)]MDG4667646.1 polysaccharide deacetylase family protein [Mycobacterium sp. 236(2023)]
MTSEPLPPFTYSPITERPVLRWPDGASVAVYVGLNIEHFLPNRPSTSIWPGTAELSPDPLNHGWRDYGARVGIWRTIEALDDHGMRASALVNSTVAEAYPQIISAGVERNWAWLAHGQTNSVLHNGFDADSERRILAEITDTIDSATGRRPLGWMGPGLTETHHTPQLLAELGYRYVLDWTNDDQPYELTIPGMLSVPYSVELNDLLLFGKGCTGEQFVQIVKDQYDQLRVDAATGGRVLALALHPFVIGQAFRHRYLVEALSYLAAQPEAWLTTGDDIAAYFLAQRC